MRKLLAFLLTFSLSHGTVLYPIPVEIKQRVGYLWIEGRPGQTFEVQTESQDLIAYPPVLRLNREGKGTVRLAFKRQAEDTELFSRVILKEVKTSEGLDFVYSFSIPVYQPPKRQEVKVSLTCKDRRISIRNEGNVHVKITSVQGKEAFFICYLKRKCRYVWRQEVFTK